MIATLHQKDVILTSFGEWIMSTKGGIKHVAITLEKC